MNNILQFIRRRPGQALSLLRDTRGLSTVEYVIILVLIAFLAIGTWRQFGTTVQGKVNTATTGIETLN
ncbi:MAG TPA: hypothetical protein VJV79_12695 [Polyangiaceae bacterium]|nr:hypothetical protein [Polyangiaceae bacterium]